MTLQINQIPETTTFSDAHLLECQEPGGDSKSVRGSTVLSYIQQSLASTSVVDYRDGDFTEQTDYLPMKVGTFTIPANAFKENGDEVLLFTHFYSWLEPHHAGPDYFVKLGSTTFQFPALAAMNTQYLIQTRIVRVSPTKLRLYTTFDASSFIGIEHDSFTASDVALPIPVEVTLDGNGHSSTKYACWIYKVKKV